MSERLLALEHRMNLLEQVRPFYGQGNMSITNWRLARTVNDGTGYPTSGNTFFIEFIDGSYTKAKGLQSPMYSVRQSLNVACHNIRSILPSVGTILLVFEWHGYWWTDYYGYGSLGGGSVVESSQTLHEFKSTDSGANFDRLSATAPASLTYQVSNSQLGAIASFTVPNVSITNAFLKFTGTPFPSSQEDFNDYNVAALQTGAPTSTMAVGQFGTPVFLDESPASWDPSKDFNIDVTTTVLDAIAAQPISNGGTIHIAIWPTIFTGQLGKGRSANTFQLEQVT